jgi:hypothetical protein
MSHLSLLCRHSEHRHLYCLLASFNLKLLAFYLLEAEALDGHFAHQAASHHVAPWWITPSLPIRIIFLATELY